MKPGDADGEAKGSSNRGLTVMLEGLTTAEELLRAERTR